MALTPSTMLGLGTPAPDFSLTDPATGLTHARADLAGRPLLVKFICNHCPYVVHVAPALAAIGHDYGDRVAMVAINSNDVDNYPADHPDKMVGFKDQHGFPFPYLFDHDQSVAAAYTAACTPDVFLFDADHNLYYRGQVDDTRPNRVSSGVYNDARGQATGASLRAALDALLNGQPAPEDQLPSTGCNIKWKPGQVPEHAQ